MPALIWRLYDGAFLLLAALAALAIGAATVLITLDVVLRNSGLGNLPWLTEVVEYALYVMTFLGAPWVLRLGRHVRMDLVLTLLPQSASRAVEAVVSLGGCLICLILLVYAFRATAAAFTRGSLIMKTLVIPEWWLLAVMPLCFALLSVEFARRVVVGLRGKPAAAEPGAGL